MEDHSTTGERGRLGEEEEEEEEEEDQWKFRGRATLCGGRVRGRDKWKPVAVGSSFVALPGPRMTPLVVVTVDAAVACLPACLLLLLLLLLVVGR